MHAQCCALVTLLYGRQALNQHLAVFWVITFGVHDWIAIFKWQLFVFTAIWLLCFSEDTILKV